MNMYKTWSWKLFLVDCKSDLFRRDAMGYSELPGVLEVTGVTKEYKCNRG